MEQNIDYIALSENGNKKFTDEDYPGAILDYTQAIALNSNDAELYYNRGNAKYNLNDFFGAIADYNVALEIDSGYDMVYNNRGNAKNALNDYRGAIADYSAAITADVEDATAAAGLPLPPLPGANAIIPGHARGRVSSTRARAASCCY